MVGVSDFHRIVVDQDIDTNLVPPLDDNVVAAGELHFRSEVAARIRVPEGAGHGGF
jgi:hypothetical protein